MANKNFKVRQGLEAPLIAADDGTTAITLSGDDVTVVGDLTVTSNTIKSSSATALTLSGADVAVAGDLVITGGDLSTVSGSNITLTTSLSTDPFTVVRTSTQTGSTDTIRTLTLRANSTGTPVIGFGNVIEFETESTPGTFVQSAYIQNKATGDNAGVLDDFNMSFGVMSAGVSSERMVLDNLGNLQIDGNLDVQGGTITDSTGALSITSGATNTNITLTPNGTGDVILSADTVQVGDSNANATITTNGTGDLILNTNAGTNSGSITIADGVNGNITLAPNGTGQVISGVTQLADNSMVMGSLLTTTNSSYTFPAIPITRVSGNNGLDVASSTVIASGNLGNAAQQQLTHYSGDILAGSGTTANFVLRTANGNSVTGSTLPFTGLSQTAASGLVTGDAMGALSFNGHATTDFTDFLGTRNQGGGFIGANSMQIQGIAAENFVDGTLTISGATITAVSRVNSAMSSVTVTGTRGQISFTATTPSVGQAVNVTGTNTGTSTGIVAGVYYIVATANTTSATLSATPGGVPITTTAGTTTGLSFARRFITVTFTAQTYIPFGLQAFVAISGFTGATDGTYMTFGSGTTTTVNIGVSTASVALSGTQSLSTPTVTNAGSALRIRSIPVATPLNSSNRIDIVDHRPSAAIYRADSFTFNTGAYGNTGVGVTGNNIIYNRVYGQFQYNTTVTPAAADTAAVFPLGTADINNIATVGSTSRLIAGAAGIYNLQFSVQVDNADNNNDHDAYIWLRKNGSDVTGSMGRTTVTKNNVGSLKIIAWNYIVSSANTTDYWEIAYAVSDTDVTFPAFASTAFGPSTATIITSLVPVGA
jgi:hypothetical protein